jgi:hypothetical protein
MRGERGRFDDLGVVDTLAMDRGDTEVAVADLALDDDQRNAFAKHLHGVSVPELMRREAAANAGGREAGGLPSSTMSRAA